MSANNYGVELKSLVDLLRGRAIPTAATALDFDVTTDFIAIIDQANSLLRSPGPGGERGLIFEIPPGHFLLRRPDEERDAVAPFVFDLPRNVHLYMCPGALLRPAENVALVIRGSLFAGPYQIFGYDRHRERDRTPEGRTPPLGRIIFAGKLVPALYPEWWGAQISSDSVLLTDNAPALQAAIDASCVTRDHPEPDSLAPHPRPSLPVLLGGPYFTHRTLTVNVNPSDGVVERHLILRGRAGLGTPNVGEPSIKRILNLAGTLPGNDDLADKGCLLRLGPDVSFDIEGVNFSINQDGGDTSDLRVQGCVDIDGRDDGEVTRRGVFRRCSFAGGRQYALRVRAKDDARLRQFHVRDSAIAPCTPNRISLYGVEVRAGSSSMCHIEGSVMGIVELSPEMYPTPQSLPRSALMYLQGGSVLMQAVQTHGGSGPRPSRGDQERADSIELHEPDGQEVFIAPRDDGGSSTQFTGMHIEAQGWWFLSRPQDGDDQVVLINVAHGNVNRLNPYTVERFRHYFGRGATNPLPTGGPPSVIWLGKGGRCVMIGCRFDWSFLTANTAWPQIIDVGCMFQVTTFTSAAALMPGFTWDPRFVPTGNTGTPDVDPGGHFRPADSVFSVPRFPTYAWRMMEQDETFDLKIPHVVPRIDP